MFAYPNHYNPPGVYFSLSSHSLWVSSDQTQPLTYSVWDLADQTQPPTWGGGKGVARAGGLSSFMLLSSSSRAIKFLYAPAPPPPTVWALKPPSLALVHKTTYAPMIYTALCVMFWMRAYPLHGQVGGGWAMEISSFFSP